MYKLNQLNLNEVVSVLLSALVFYAVLNTLVNKVYTVYLVNEIVIKLITIIILYTSYNILNTYIFIRMKVKEGLYMIYISIHISEVIKFVNDLNHYFRYKFKGGKTAAQDRLKDRLKEEEEVKKEDNLETALNLNLNKVTSHRSLNLNLNLKITGVIDTLIKYKNLMWLTLVLMFNNNNNKSNNSNYNNNNNNRSINTSIVSIYRTLKPLLLFSNNNNKNNMSKIHTNNLVVSHLNNQFRSYVKDSISSSDVVKSKSRKILDSVSLKSKTPNKTPNKTEDIKLDNELLNKHKSRLDNLYLKDIDLIKLTDILMNLNNQEAVFDKIYLLDLINKSKMLYDIVDKNNSLLVHINSKGFINDTDLSSYDLIKEVLPHIIVTDSESDRKIEKQVESKKKANLVVKESELQGKSLDPYIKGNYLIKRDINPLLIAGSEVSIDHKTFSYETAHELYK